MFTSGRTSLEAGTPAAQDAFEVFEAQLPWHVLHVRSRTEKVVSRKAGAFRDAELLQYLPLRERVQIYQRRRVCTHLPLFPGYIFLRAEEEAASRFALRTREVVSCLQVHDQECFSESMFSLKRMLSSGLPVSPVEKLENGAAVEIVSGPLTGLKGYVVSKLKSTRFVLAVEMLQQGASVEVDAHMIEPL